MPLEKATAIVLRVTPFSETSSVVTLFTREAGKLSGLAKGARRPKGPFDAALDLLSTCRVVFLRKSSEALDLLTEAKLSRRFRWRGPELSRLYAGYYVAELLSELTDDYDAHPQLFDEADETLAELGFEPRPAHRMLRFEMSALRILGHAPTLELCAECGGAVTQASRVAFSSTAGGVLCSDCRGRHAQVVLVTPGVLRTLERFVDASSDAWRRLEIDAGVRGELRGVVNNYMAHLIGRPPRLQRYLTGLSN